MSEHISLLHTRLKYYQNELHLYRMNLKMSKFTTVGNPAGHLFSVQKAFMGREECDMSNDFKVGIVLHQSIFSLSR